MCAGMMPDHSSLITDTGYATISNTTRVSMAPHCRVYVSFMPHAHVGSWTGRGFIFTRASVVITRPDQSFSHSQCIGSGVASYSPWASCLILCIKCYWNTVTPAPRYTLCFHTTTAELSRCGSDCQDPGAENTSSLSGPSRESSPTPARVSASHSDTPNFEAGKCKPATVPENRTGTTWRTALMSIIVTHTRPPTGQHF